MKHWSLYTRYSRQVILKDFGETSQKKLMQAGVLVIGAGGLGCPALQYLVAAGVGRVGIVDDDRVALSNLHRQTLFTTAEIGLSKAIIAAQRLRDINPEVTISAYNERLAVGNALELFSQYDIVLDGSDNFATRYLVNDATAMLGIPLVYGAVSQFEGQVAIFNVKSEGVPMVSYRDLFPTAPRENEVLNCAEAGVLGVLPGIIGTMQAAEAIKLITGLGEPLINRLFTYNVLSNQTYETQINPMRESANLIPKDADAFKATDYQWLCEPLPEVFEIGSEEFNRMLDKENVLIVDIRDPDEKPSVTEFEHERIPMAELLHSDLSKRSFDAIVVFCQSGKRSREMVKQLSVNHENVYRLKGGILNWKLEQQNSSVL